MMYRFCRRSGVNGVIYEDGDRIDVKSIPADVVRSLKLQGSLEDCEEFEIPEELPPPDGPQEVDAPSVEIQPPKKKSK